MSGRDPPDATLVARAQAGDPQAFSQLVERHQPALYAVALRMLGRREDALDAVQETFLAAYRHLDRFRGDAALSTWLHRIALNTCYDLLRKRREEPVAEPPEVAGDHRFADDPADVAISAADVQRALLAVPVEFRAVLVLCDAQDLPYAAAADILDLPVGTVKSRLHRGRLALARGLTRSDPLEPVRAPRPSNTPRP